MTEKRDRNVLRNECIVGYVIHHNLQVCQNNVSDVTAAPGRDTNIRIAPHCRSDSLRRLTKL